MRLESALAFKITLGTARVYVNSADEYHGSQTRTYNLFAQGRKKCATHVPLLFSAMFSLYDIFV